MASTKTILASLEWAKRFIYNRQLSIGDFKEPLITSANTVLQTILGKPFKWQFNRVISGFVATASQQDYLLLYAWPASQVLTAGTLVVDAAGNSQKVTTPGTTNSTIPSFNGTLNGTTSRQHRYVDECRQDSKRLRIIQLWMDRERFRSRPDFEQVDSDREQS